MQIQDIITRGYTHRDARNAHFLLSEDVMQRNDDIRRWLDATGAPFVEHVGPWYREAKLFDPSFGWPESVAIGNIWELCWKSPFDDRVPCRVVVFNQFHTVHGDAGCGSVEPTDNFVAGVSPLPTTCTSFVGGSLGWGDAEAWHKMQRIDDNEATVLFGILSALPIRLSVYEWEGLPSLPPDRTDFFYEFRLNRWKQRARAAIARRWAWMMGVDGAGGLALVESQGGEVSLA